MSVKYEPANRRKSYRTVENAANTYVGSSGTGGALGRTLIQGKREETLRNPNTNEALFMVVLVVLIKP